MLSFEVFKFDGHGSADARNSPWDYPQVTELPSERHQREEVHTCEVSYGYTDS